MSTELIRNFSIIAHIDHGKSTLADRLIEVTNTVASRDMKPQLLDTMDLERERGITIKLQAVRLEYKASDNKTYLLNLIDTPGHVDFTYEVSRSLAACEGALLLVDASQGIEAQTMANYYLALENDLEIIPVLNKIDLPSVELERVLDDVERVFGFKRSDCLLCSAKSGLGVKEILEAVVAKIPPPKDLQEEPLKALIFDAHYDSYRGVICYVRVFSGMLTKGQQIEFMVTGKKYEVLETGFFKPKMTPADRILSGEVGYVIANIKKVEEAKVGDTITDAKRPAPEPLEGYKEVKPMVFCGFYPIDTNDYVDLKDALEKLKLNDSSLQYVGETSQALGFGFRCGFLGLLHLEIIQERLEREFNIDIIATAPNVTYKLTKNNGDVIHIESPDQFPEPQFIKLMEEPFMSVNIITPNSYLGTVMELAQEKRGEFKKSEYLDTDRQVVYFNIPLNEMISDFFDLLKSGTKGYASMDYSLADFRPSKLVKVNIQINGEPVDALSFIGHESKARTMAQKMTEKLKTLIPRQLYEIVIQGTIGGKIICRETVSALRKNVTAKCYGGDISRKRKLLEKQKEGKKKMKSIGSIQVPKEAFLAILKK
ncbi:MAG: translation elongation factor 4 [Candidatus Margulisiibacteriota bacterium]|jgi:GTP-binding protein LepA